MSFSAATRSANEATADDLASSVSPTRTVGDKSFSFSVKTTCDLHDGERDRIWRIFEENMRELYSSSSFGWKPRQKRSEMFDPLSRYVIARDLSESANGLASSGIVAYTTFRFDREDDQDVIYCYELQVSKHSRRFGLGRLLTRMLSDIGAHWGMRRVMLTVFRANHAAVLFYKAVGFTMDETSPDLSKDLKGRTEDECDYTILSRRIS